MSIEDPSSLGKALPKGAIFTENKRVIDILKRLIDSKPFPLLMSPLAKFATHKLKLAENGVTTIEDYLQLVFWWHFFPLDLHDFFTIKPAQIREEMRQLLTLASSLHPRTILEIGTALGGTLYLFAKVAESDAIIVSVDLRGGPFGGGYPDWKIPLYRSFAKSRQRICLIGEDSHDPLVLDKIKEVLNGRKLDIVFIDGDHRYEGVKKDFEMYGPLVRGGGLIAFHDIVTHARELGGEVTKFWNEIKYSYRHLEIVKDWNQKWGGIGVLFIE